jgi:hypothetical protein
MLSFLIHFSFPHLAVLEKAWELLLNVKKILVKTKITILISQVFNP